MIKTHAFIYTPLSKEKLQEREEMLRDRGRTRAEKEAAFRERMQTPEGLASGYVRELAPDEDYHVEFGILVSAGAPRHTRASEMARAILHHVQTYGFRSLYSKKGDGE